MSLKLAVIYYSSTATVDSMARRVDGRMVSPELDDLGAAVVGSYLGSRGPGTSYREHFGDIYGGGRGFWV